MPAKQGCLSFQVLVQLLCGECSRGSEDYFQHCQSEERRTDWTNIEPSTFFNDPVTIFQPSLNHSPNVNETIFQPSFNHPPISLKTILQPSSNHPPYHLPTIFYPFSNHPSTILQSASKPSSNHPPYHLPTIFYPFSNHPPSILQASSNYRPTIPLTSL
jgi:hypothetical protein